MSDLSPQCELVLQYLQSGRTLTNLIAMTSLRVYALPRRIKDLKDAGYKIVSETKHDHLGAKYASYALEAPKEPAKVQHITRY